MKSNATSGRRLSLHVSVCALMLLISVTGTAHAKRGCSAFGHSCFGGHGKRFDPQLKDNAIQENGETTSDRNPEFENLRLTEEFVVPEKFGGQPEIILPQTRRQASSRFDPYTLSFIVGQWLSSHRRLHQPDVELNNK